MTGWLLARRPARLQPGDVERAAFRTQTRGMGLRLLESVRDRLRPRWLRLRQPEPRATEPPAAEPPATEPSAASPVVSAQSVGPRSSGASAP